ncbi:MAG: hypothetical protein KKH44_07255 [Bacteroidetes bacterium]|nr:hypothetical protein [Bacteroidota bacterium]
MKTAKNNLLNNISCFGIQNKFQESLFLFEKDLGWKKGIKYESKNMRSEGFKASKFSNKEIDCVKSLNTVDIELYKEAVDMFESKWLIFKKKNQLRVLKHNLLGI